MNIPQKFMSRKFILAFIGAVVSSVALFTGSLEGAEWITAQSLILGLYGAASVANNKVKSD